MIVWAGGGVKRKNLGENGMNGGPVGLNDFVFVMGWVPGG